LETFDCGQPEHKEVKKKMPSVGLTSEQVIRQCLVAYGSGTGGIPTKHEAIEESIAFFLPMLEAALQQDPQRFSGVDDQHKLEKLFILRCVEAIGRLAAHYATARGAIAIGVDDTIAARGIVIIENGGAPLSPYCHNPALRKSGP
jgi:hypothetical protein